MENTTTQSGEESETEIVSAAAPESELAESELVESNEPEELADFDVADEDGEENTGSGFVSGAFGLTSLALALASLSGGWLGTVYGAREEYLVELKATSQNTQTSLNAFHSSWHAQAALGGIFALASLLIGAGVLASPALLLSGKTPAWARATALGGVILALIGLLLAILTWFNVIAPGLTAPPAAAG
ncbi:hypothetical protein KGA66_16095 [Actinocrinis puniceicyclus]|uniref:Uncharacterized protein n=1 Tax=Actinocrinis puniceicyclus TaxID=977794 RepID=A0A8J7WNI7_9ACTN|nr:hypothetical protein [Actinocrinis puniceicyclus]MBS2964578.1 hypothetical protein [Actinocrinis puniceicyclus]